MKTPTRIFLAVALLGGTAACGGGTGASPATKALGSFRYAQSCEEVKSFARGYAERLQKNPDRAVPVSAPAAEPATPTNGAAPEAASDAAGTGAVVQSDMAFPDPARGLLYAFGPDRKLLRIFRVNPAAQAQLAASLELDFQANEVVATQAKGRAFAVLFGGTGGYYGIEPQPLPAQTMALRRGKAEETPPTSQDSPIFPNPEEPKAVVAVVEVTDPEHPQLLREEQSPGYFLEARALSSSGQILWVTEHYVPLYADPLSDDQILPKKVVRQSGAADQTPVADCQRTYLYENPTLDPEYSPYSLNATFVSLLDLGSPELAAVTQAIYAPSWRSLIAANPQHLFLAQNVDHAQGYDTELYQFDLGGEALLALSASTSVPGSIPNQFFLDERDGVLRVFHQVQNFGPICLDNCSGSGGAVAGVPVAAMKAQTETAAGNYLSAFRQQGAQLGLIGRSGPFEPEESLYAARFVGSLGCAITFKQIDPLTCFSLKDPTQPTKLGELQIEGVSFHLEAITDTLLLGIGQGAGNSGVVANLFDIGNPSQPSLAAQRTLSGGYAYSPVFYDYRALGKDETSRNFAVPIENEAGSTLALFSVDPAAKQILPGGNLSKSFSPDGPYDSFQRAFFFSETLATVSIETLDVYLRAGLSPVFSAPLGNGP